jgi:hypothetical protein
LLRIVLNSWFLNKKISKKITPSYIEEGVKFQETNLY